MPKEPSSGHRDAVAEVVNASLDFVRGSLRISQASHSHRDRMLTWTVGLMGGGLLRLRSLIGALCTDRRHLLGWVMSSWLFGIILALVVRIIGERHAYRLRVEGLAEASELRLLLIQGLDSDSLEHEFGQVSHKYVNLSEKTRRLDQVTEYLYYVTLVFFLAGTVALALRVVTC
jgi:hypothetical protein